MIIEEVLQEEEQAKTQSLLDPEAPQVNLNYKETEVAQVNVNYKDSQT